MNRVKISFTKPKLTLSNFEQDMLSLCALFGSLVGPFCNHVLLFAELGGKFLGKLDVPQTLVASNMLGVLKDLQLQAFKLMKHATRPPRDVLLKVGDEPLLPFGFGYKEELDVDQQAVVLAMLKDVSNKTNKKRVYMNYDETDEYATMCVARRGIKVIVTDEAVQVTLGEAEPCVDELAAVCTKHKSLVGACFVKNHKRITTDLSFLAGRKELCLQEVTPTTWTGFEELESLYSSHARLASPVSQLSNLRILHLSGACQIPDEIQELNLHDAYFYGVDTSASRLVKLVQHMPNLYSLQIVNLAELSSIPLEVANLTNLVRLRLMDSFIGDVPRDLALLTKLTRLEITGPVGLFDPSIPQEVLDLNIEEVIVQHS